jgi:hypothetical protein
VPLSEGPHPGVGVDFVPLSPRTRQSRNLTC